MHRFWLVHGLGLAGVQPALGGGVLCHLGDQGLGVGMEVPTSQRTTPSLRGAKRRGSPWIASFLAMTVLGGRLSAVGGW